MKSHPPSRRAFLGGALAGTMALPLLPSRFAGAAEYPRRFVFVEKPNGTEPAYFWPKGTGTALSGLTLPAITAPLEPWKSKINFLGGINLENGFDMWPFDGHAASAHLLSGMKGLLVYDHPDPGHRIYGVGGPTLDHALSLLPEMRALAFPRLNLGARSGDSRTPKNSVSASGANQYNAIVQDPFTLFTQFSQKVGGTGDPVAAKRKRERKSVLDFVGKRVERWVANAGSTEDRERLQRHLDAVKTQQQALDATVAACTPKDPGARFDLTATDKIPDLYRLQMDNVALALSCDLTRVVTLTLNDGDGVHGLPWLGDAYSGKPVYEFDNATTRTHHDVSHVMWNDADQTKLKVGVETWYSQQLAYLLTKLDALPEGDGSVLDHTVVVFASNMNLGNMHTISHVPIITAGSCGGRLRTGQFLRFGNFAQAGWEPTRSAYEAFEDDNPAKRAQGVAMNGVLVAVAKAIGLDVDSYGDPNRKGALPGLLV